VFVLSSRRRLTSFDCDWSSDVCSSDLVRSGEHRMSQTDTWIAPAPPARLTEPSAPATRAAPAPPPATRATEASPPATRAAQAPPPAARLTEAPPAAGAAQARQAELAQQALSAKLHEAQELLAAKSARAK